MRKDEITVGGHYVAKVNGTLTVVEIERTPFGENGWTGKNLRTGRYIVLRTAARLRRRATDEEVVGAERYRRAHERK